MSEFNILYRAFCDYRKITSHENEEKKHRLEIKRSNKENDFIQTKRYMCEIKDDWISHIEQGIDFVVNAIQEERQFIRTDGEVIPIEKVKKVSRATVAHLAKHSNLITRLPEKGQTVIPEKLYIVEKNSDYAVYENRFLYMMLCYLRDFIDLRSNKIKELLNHYSGESKVDKSIELNKRKISFKMEMYEERTDNPYPLLTESVKIQLERISDLAKTVQTLLQTDLMTQVSKTPMIKPPVVKTNVLKMNNNFRNALALYEYVSNYEGDGFTFEETINTITPYTDEIADEYSEFVLLTSFLTYQYGNNLKAQFKLEYDEEEKRLKALEQEKLAEKIRALKRRVKNSGVSIEEYMLMLEERNNYLEADSLELKKVKQIVLELESKIDDLNKEIALLNLKISELNKVIDEKNKEIAYLKQKYIDDIAALKKAHQEEIIKINENHKKHIENLMADFDKEINDLNTQHEEEINQINAQHDEEVLAIKTEYDSQITEITASYKEEIALANTKFVNKIRTLTEDYTNQINDLNIEVSEKTTRINEIEGTIEGFNAEKNQAIVECENERIRVNNEAEAKINQRFAAAEKLVSNANEKAKNRVDSIKVDMEILEDENRRILAELHALKSRDGLLTADDDFTSKERFIELEKEYIAFYRFFKNQWKDTKKKIRKELLWSAQNDDPRKKKKSNVTDEDIEKLNETNVLKDLSSGNRIDSNNQNLTSNNEQRNYTEENENDSIVDSDNDSIESSIHQQDDIVEKENKEE